MTRFSFKLERYDQIHEKIAHGGEVEFFVFSSNYDGLGFRLMLVMDCCYVSSFGSFIHIGKKIFCNLISILNLNNKF